MAGGGIPQILWGTNFENVLQFGYPIDSPVTGRKPRDGSEWGQSASGVEDAWITGYDYELSADFRWIPDDQQTDPVASPWGGPVGVQAFLDWARQKNTFRYVPDMTVPDFYVDGCYLAEPLDSHGSLESDATRNLHLLIRNPSVDFALALRGVMFEYAPGASLTDPVAATVTRATAATRRGKPSTSMAAAIGASDVAGVLRDRHYEGALRTTLLEALRAQLVTDPENFGAWTAIGTPILTSGQVDPFGGTAAYLLNDDDAVTVVEGIFQVVTFAGNATKAFSVFLKQGTSDDSSIEVWDNTALVDRISIKVTWTAGVPSMAITAGAGTLFPVENWGGGWYRLPFAANGVIAANATRLYLYPTQQTNTDTGTTYFFGANAWNATFPSSYQGPSLTTKNADVFSWGHAYKPQAMFRYTKLVERGTILSGAATVVLEIADAPENVPALILDKGASAYRTTHYNAATSVNVVLGAAPAFGDTVELLEILNPDGSVKLLQSINGAAATSAGPSAALAFAAAWSSPTLVAINSRGNGVVAGFNAFARVKIGPLTFGGVTRDTIAKALLA